MARLPHEGDGVVRLVEDAACQVDEDAPGLGQLHPATAAVEELHTELVLEPSDLLAQRQLGNVLTLGGPTEVQLSATVRK